MKGISKVMAVFTAMTFIAVNGFAATPSGFSNTTMTVTAQVIALCRETQHGSFPNPLIIDPFSASDQIFLPNADEFIKCTNGTIFTVKVSSANGTALDEICTSSGVSNMKFISASSPADDIPYIFMCAGDTDGAGHFTGAGDITAKAMGISIRIPAANAKAALARDDYSDTVTLTINY